MSAEDVANILQRNSNIPIKEVAQIITQMQGIREPISEDEYLDILINAEETRLRQTTVSVTKGDVIKNEQRDRKMLGSQNVMRRKLNSTPKFYPLTHNHVGPAFTYSKANESLIGGAGVVFGGSNYEVIADHARFSALTDEIAVAGWIYVPAAQSGSVQYILRKSTSGNTWGFVRVANSDNLQFFTKIGGGTQSATVAATPDAWNHFVGKWKSPTISLRLNDVTEDTATASGTLGTSSEGLGIGAQPNGSNPLNAGHKLAWLSILHKEVTSSWTTDHFNKILDTSGLNEEVTTIPCDGTMRPQPESSFGIVVI